VGLKMTLAESFNNFTWYGRGPHENYPDRKRGAAIGRYTGRVKDQYVPYALPEDNGNKEDVRWIAVTDDSGDGLMIVADTLMSVSALHFKANDLLSADHINELIPRKEVYLNLNYKQRGLGTKFHILESYIIYSEPFNFTIELRPYYQSLGEIGKTARMKFPL